MTPAHPDPLGITLSALRRHLHADEARRACAFFVECVPPRDSNPHIALEALRLIYMTRT
jgi:hypothetical protein